MRDEVVKALLTKVKQDYSLISRRFDQTRSHPWGEFSFFEKYLKNGDSLLDCGCGNGRLYSFLKPKKIRYKGVDNNKELIELARFRHPKAEFTVGDQTELPFLDESFDHIWNIAAFHHVPSKTLRKKTMKEMHRVLKKDGYLVLTVWNLWQKKYRGYVYKSILKNLLFGEFEYNDTFIPWGKEKLVERYYHAFHMKELRELITQAGFKIIDVFWSKGNQSSNWHKAHNLCFVAKKVTS